MKFSQSPSTIFWLISTGIVLGIGLSSVVYWLVIAPENTEHLANTIPPIPSEPLQPITESQSTSDEDTSAPVSPLASISRLDELNDISNAFEQGLALRLLLSNSDESETAALLEQSEATPLMADRSDVQMAIVQRLAHLNPKRALSQLRKLDSQSYPVRYVPNIFREWSQSNLDEAVAHAATMRDDWKGAAVQAIVHRRMDLSDDVLLSIARELGDEQIASSVIVQRKIQKAIGDPEKAWHEIALELQNDQRHMQDISRIASAWVEKSGLPVLDQIAQTLTNGQVRQNVIRNILFDVVNSDPEGAFKYALTIDRDIHNSILRSVASTWARSDPQSALVAAAEVEKKSLRRELVEQVVESWARDKPREVLKVIDSLPKNAQEPATAAAVAKIARNSPKEAATLISAMENSSAKTMAAISVANTWATQDHEAALAWILDEPAIEQDRQQMLSSIMYSLVQIDPQLAMDTALSQPIEEGAVGMFLGMGMELNVIASLAYSDLDKAIELLPQVREGPTKMQAFAMISGALIQNGEIDEAFNMARQAPESERNQVYMGVAAAWAGSDPEGVLNSMDRFPSDEIKSRAALVIVSYNQFQKNLTDEQIEEAKTFLTEEDAKTLEKGPAGMFELLQGW
ncbi:MAG: hypothetical protein OXG24_02450 [Gammaproteobacteria bacterium]|nr:hypothetical protein [Gammaproteobacteria bacterium]